MFAMMLGRSPRRIIPPCRYFVSGDECRESKHIWYDTSSCVDLFTVSMRGNTLIEVSEYKPVELYMAVSAWQCR